MAAARAAFLREGYNVGMEAIARSAGVSKVTIYNHFGNKEALFIAVVGDALDEALDSTLAAVEAGLSSTGDVRVALLNAVRACVEGVTQPAVLELLYVVAAEMRIFPELVQAWRERGPGRFYPTMESALRKLVANRALEIPDVEVAVLQLYALTLYPHLVAGLYGDKLRPALGERLSVQGVDLFLAYYTPRGEDSKTRPGPRSSNTAQPA
ncbi:TetR family transcriptional regulator [Asanoa ishikariensis]|nr:TetR family transcriptional regulator [Asanoa ishikariensis]